MKNYIFKSIIFCCLAISCLTIQAASEAEYRNVFKTWTLHPDGSQEYRYGMELTLFTHTAMNSTYGESFILYNPEYQELKFHASYTKQVDGSIIQTPDNAFVEVLPRFATDAAAYNHLKEMVVVHTGLELGATIYLDYSIITKPGYYPALDICEIVQESSPVKNYTVSVIVPENTPLHWQLYASSVKPAESKANGLRTLSWPLRNIPASSREAFLPQNGNGIPCLVATTYTNVTEALISMDRRWNSYPRLETETFARFITENANNETDKLRIIREHVVNKMGTSAIPLEQIGYNNRPLDEVLRSAYGTVAEKTQLLNVMLNAAGIPSEIVAAYPVILNKDACGLKAIKGWAVKVRTNNGKEDYITAVGMTPASVVKRGTLDRLISLNGKELVINAVPEEIKETKEIIINADNANNGFVICTLPSSSKGMDSWRMNTLNSGREQMFEIPTLLQEEITYVITPKDGMKLQTPVTTKSITKPFGSFTQTITQEGDQVKVVRKITLNKQQYTPAEYKELRPLIIEWVNPTNRTLLFSAK